MKELIDGSNSDELRRENKKLKGKLALMKSQNDYRDKMLNSNEIKLNAKDSDIKAKDEEIDLLRKKIREYENIKK
jgi:hypothetical protein